MGYSIEMKEAVVKKFLLGGKLNYEIAKEAGVSRSTLCKWVKHYRNDGNITLNTKEKRPQDWTSKERMSWCWKNGLFDHHLKQWKKDAITAVKCTNPPPKGTWVMSVDHT